MRRILRHCGRFFGLSRRFLRREDRLEGEHAHDGHLEGDPGAGRPLQFLLTQQGGLVALLHPHRVETTGEGVRQGDVLIGRGGAKQLQQGHAVELLGQRFQQEGVVGAFLRQLGEHAGQGIGVLLGQRLQQCRQRRFGGQSEHLAHGGLVHLATALHHRLIQQAEGIAHGAVGMMGQQVEGAVRDGEAFRLGHPPQVFGDQRRLQPLQVELEAAGEHGDGQLVRFGGGEDELDVFRRLFQRLEQRIEAALGEHVHFVDQVDLEAALRRQILDIVQQFAGVLHLGARGGVDFDQVDEAAFVNGTAGIALATGLGGDAALAVERLGEHPSEGGLAHAAGAGEQVGVMQPLLRQRMGERLDHMGLPHQLREVPGTPFARQRQCLHGYSSLGKREAILSGCGRMGGDLPAGTSAPTQTRYRCFLPDLAGFPGACREGTNRSPH